MFNEDKSTIKTLRAERLCNPNHVRRLHNITFYTNKSSVTSSLCSTHIVLYLAVTLRFLYRIYPVSNELFGCGLTPLKWILSPYDYNVIFIIISWRFLIYQIYFVMTYCLMHWVVKYIFTYLKNIIHDANIFARTYNWSGMLALC